MVKLIEDNYCVDTTHIFAKGFSYGGGMSYEIACARAKVFRGVAIYEGAQLSGCDGGNDPIAFWQMVGLTDTTCRYGHWQHRMRDRFVKNNGCTAQTPPQPPQASPLFEPRGACLHGLRRVLGRASPPLVRAPVRSRQRHRGWDLGPLQFVRDTSQDLLDLVPVYLGPGRRVVVDDVALVAGRVLPMTDSATGRH